MDKGIELRPWISMDFQFSSGLGRGHAYEITRGKRTAILLNAGMLFRTSELWKNLIHLGGASSMRRFGVMETKGEPSQLSYHSVSAAPIVLKDLTVVDVTRKA
jgi:predicted Zn-dependent protease